jgi:VanZ family protein
MAVIYALSAQPDLGTGLGAWDSVLRKLAHAVEFGLLFLLWVFAFGSTRRRALVAAAVIAIGYAISDELHQTTVDGRVGSPVDVLIDATGVALAAVALRVGLPHAARRARARSRQPHA